MISAFGVEHGEVSKGLINFARKHKVLAAVGGYAAYNKVANTLTKKPPLKVKSPFDKPSYNLQVRRMNPQRSYR